jgi:hypothetical protein
VPAFVLPGGIIGGASLLSYGTIVIIKKLRSRLAGSASDGRKTGRP